MKTLTYLLVSFVFSMKCLSLASSSCYEQKSCSFLELKCREGYKIVSPKFWGTDSSCWENSSECRGLTPEMMIEQANCYWQNNCTITIPGEYETSNIVRLVQGITDRNCFTKRVTSIREANSWTCVNASAVRTICALTDKITPAEGLFGVIKSHDIYPWNYDGRVFSQTECPDNHHLSEVAKSCTARFDVYLLARDNFNRVAVSVSGEIDTDDEYDNLTFRGGYWTTADKKTYVNHHGQQLVLNFTRRALCEKDGYKNGRGFVLCYKYLMSGEDVPEGMSVCDQILERPSVPARCIQCKYDTAEDGRWTYCDTEYNTTELVVSLTNDSDHEWCAPNKTEDIRQCACKYNSARPVNETRCNVDTGKLEKTLQKQEDSDSTCKLFRIVIEKCVCRYKYKKRTRCIGGIKMKVGNLIRKQPSYCPRRHSKKVRGHCRKRPKKKNNTKRRRKNRGSRAKGKGSKKRTRQQRRGRRPKKNNSPKST